MDWLNSHGELSDSEILNLIGKNMLNRASSWVGYPNSGQVPAIWITMMTQLSFCQFSQTQ
jgi:hypothetical protein